MTPTWLPPIRTRPPPRSRHNSSLREPPSLTPPLTPSSSIDSALPTPDRFAFPSFSSPESFTNAPSRPPSPSGPPYRKSSNPRMDVQLLTRKRSFFNAQHDPEDSTPSRFILVGGVPKDKTALEFKHAFAVSSTSPGLTIAHRYYSTEPRRAKGDLYTLPSRAWPGETNALRVSGSNFVARV